MNCNLFKRITCLLLSVVMVIGMVPVTTFATEETVGTEAEEITHGHEHEAVAVSSVCSEHTYENGSCIGCGAEHPNLANFEGKVISILGDSISTFAGYIPVADGFNLAHKTRYPQDNLLTDVNETWWMQVIHQLDAKLGINDSWASTEVYNYIDEEHLRWNQGLHGFYHPDSESGQQWYSRCDFLLWWHQ